MQLPQTPSFRLDGKRALVAGGSSGIGLAAGVALAQAGAHVVLAARRLAALEEAVAALQAVGHQASAARLDVSDIHSIEEVVAQEGAFDILVNSAGLARHGPALATKPEDYDMKEYTLSNILRGNLST